MGSAIAAHLANVGVPTFLLDIVPRELNDDERRRGLTLDAPDVRNRFAKTGLDRVLKSQPAALYSPARAELITIGNFDDHLDRLRDVDWIIEAVVEDLEIKQALLARVEAHWNPGTIVSTNTSGLPVGAIAERSGAEFRAHFVGTHFFNPPRYLKLLEVIATPHTHGWVSDTVAGWGDRMLGKTIVYAKDTPNFIANRIGTYSFLKVVQLMIDLDLEIDEVDELTGPVLGRPRSATFRTGDLVGLDTTLHVAENAYRNLPNDEERELYRPPAFLIEMAKRGWLGEKTGGGFYKRENSEILTLDYRTFEYRPRKRLSTAGLEAAKTIADPVKRAAALLAMDDKYGEFLRRLSAAVLTYTARRVPEISDDIVNVDRAMRSGFGWEQGPFEQWDALSAAGVIDRIMPRDQPLPEIVRAVRERGAGTFYRDGPDGRTYFDLRTAAYQPEPGLGDRIVLARLKQHGPVDHNPGASLIDLGDGVLCLEFHSKVNAIAEDTIQMGFRALERVRTDFDALVIANQGQDFCVGANLMLALLEAQEGNWEELDHAIRQFQRLTMAIRRSAAPIVAAPFGRTLGGGVEFCIACPHVQAAAEMYMGQVETGVGLVPAGGGTMEMTRRVAERVPDDVTGADVLPILRWGFETLALSRVSTSAEDARRLGYLRPSDGISVNGDRLLSDAKDAALALVRSNYRPAPPGLIRVVGERGYAAIESVLHIMRTGNHVTDHDVIVSKKLGYIMCGGQVPEGTRVSDEYLLDLEREAFLSLLGMPATQERIRYTLQTGRPLRN